MLTRGQIISEALSLAGRADLISNGRLWLNIYLDSMYRNQDLSFLLKSSSGMPCIQNAPLPSDYRALHTATVGVSGVPLEVVALDHFVALNQAQSKHGTPLWLCIDGGNKTAQFYPSPWQGVTWNMTYYSMPELPDPNDPLTDSEIPKWELSSDILIQAVYAKALQYLDDSRAEKAQADAQLMFTQAKMNSRDMRAGSSTFKLGKSFRRRF